jgi:hypothetical protein
MGDHSSETFELQNRRNNELYARRELECTRSFHLTEDSIPGIFYHIDCFVSQSRGNANVRNLNLRPDASFNGQGDDVWDKVGQIVGNLQSLETLHISTFDRTYGDHDDDQVRTTKF